MYNRLIPITVETEEEIDGKSSFHMIFKGSPVTEEEYKSNVGNLPIQDRILTWCDLFYMACVDVTRDKHLIASRYPIR